MGKSWQHKGTNEIVRFMSYNRDGDEITVATDGEWLKTTYYDLQVFMNKYTPVPDREETAKDHTVVIAKKDVQVLPDLKSIQMDTITHLKEALLDNIKKVREDPKYIPQAKEINATVNTIVNLARVEIDMKTKL